ncbi:putative ribonuclease H-like domain-containing protein [Tanacetum coccineum]
MRQEKDLHTNELCHENTSGTKSNHNASLHHGPGRIVTKTLSDRIMSYVDEHPSENLNSSRASNVAGKISDYKRTMRRDLTRYEDVMIENGLQIAGMASVIIVFAAFGFMSLASRVKGDILLVQVYVNDIIFGSTKKGLCTEFEKLMHKKFQMSSMGELTFFLGLQVTQKDDGIFICQDKYVDEILKKFGFLTVKTASTPIETSKPLMKDENAEDVDVHLYKLMIGSLIDYAGASLDRKSTTGGCQFLGRRLISWQCKKQTLVANSTTEAEYVVASSSYGQVLWIQNQLLDYGYNFMNTKIFIDNESTICIVKNSVFHSKTKHIEIRHHFIRDSYEKELIQVIKIHTNHNVADLLTKAFDVSRFQYLITSIGMLNL